ncbi:MAG: DNA polymerase domain-containing protein, partial [bacterium]
RIKIRGFELVRRDWCKLARDVQREVLEVILNEGDKEKSMEIVRNKIADLRKGNIKKDDLVIYTQLRKGKYKVTSPEFSAFEKARKRGVRIPIGSIIGYVITKNGKSISEKSELAQFAKDYDVDYYINNQIIPAVLKILGAFGYKEEDIKYYGKQSSLEEFSGD